MFNVEFEEVTNQFCAEFDTVVHTGDATLGEKTITANGVYNASSDDLDGYSKVTANVPNTYTASDEGKVVDNGALVSQTSATYTSNDTYDTTKINSITVNVSGGGGTMQSKSVSYTPTTSAQTDTVTPDSGYDGLSSVAVSIAAMPTGTEGTPTATKGAVSNHSVSVTPSVTNVAGYIAGGTKTGTAVTVSASELVSGTKSITANGSNQDVVGYAAVDVAVPNSYSAADEGKVVSSGALVAQASDTVTTNDTYDTTLINSLTVNVSGGGDIDALIDGSIASVESDATVVGEYKFYNCTHLTSVKLNGVAWIKGNAFRGCTALQTFDAKNVYKVHGNAFMNVPADALVFPNIKGGSGEIGASSFASWQGTKLDLGGSGFEIKLSTFSNASHFNFFVLRRNTRVILGNTNAFNGTPFASGGTGGTLYVPQAILNDYTSASNWSTILGYTNNQIKSIESTHTDPNAPIDLTLYYADGTPISA